MSSSQTPKSLKLLEKLNIKLIFRSICALFAREQMLPTQAFYHCPFLGSSVDSRFLGNVELWHTRNQKMELQDTKARLKRLHEVLAPRTKRLDIGI